MISPEDQTRIKDLTFAFWRQEVTRPAFVTIFAGKEIGHRIADYVDDQTTAMLERALPVAHERDAAGRADGARD